MTLEIDEILQREILTLHRKILSDSPFGYMQDVSGYCFNVFRKLGKLISDKGITIKHECLRCPNKDCDCIHCMYSKK